MLDLASSANFWMCFQEPKEFQTEERDPGSQRECLTDQFRIDLETLVNKRAHERFEAPGDQPTVEVGALESKMLNNTILVYHLQSLVK